MLLFVSAVMVGIGTAWVSKGVHTLLKGATNPSQQVNKKMFLLRKFQNFVHTEPPRLLLLQEEGYFSACICWW